MTKVARTPGFQKLPGLCTLPCPLDAVGINRVPLRPPCAGGWGDGGSLPGTVHFSGSSQLGTSQAAEPGSRARPLLPGGLVCLEPLSQRAHWLWRVGVRLPRQDHPGVGLCPPCLASALMSMASRDGGAGGGEGAATLNIIPYFLSRLSQASYSNGNPSFLFY